MNPEYTLHDLEWTNEKVDRFWDFHNHYKPYDDLWFSKSTGDAVINFTKKYAAINGKVLDYGTGKGYMLEHLMNKCKGADLYACDFTASIPPVINEKFSTAPAFKGCTFIQGLPSSLPENYFDAVFLLETIEHLNDEYLNATVKELYRVLKPGGIVVITTPHDENLDRAKVHCADCGAVFHVMQHIRKWTVKDLFNLAESFGFNTVETKAVNLRNYKDKSGSFYKILDGFKSALRWYNPAANLVYIGKK